MRLREVRIGDCYKVALPGGRKVHGQVVRVMAPRGAGDRKVVRISWKRGDGEQMLAACEPADMEPWVN